jgi:hypothetical protein
VNSRFSEKSITGTGNLEVTKAFRHGVGRVSPL